MEVALKMLKGYSGGQEQCELVSTARNTYVNPGSVSQFDLHQSDKSNVSFPLLVQRKHICFIDLLFIVRVKREIKRVYINGCRYN